MSSSTIKGYWREKPTKNSSISVGLQCLVVSFDPTSAGVTTGKFLPKGAIPVFTQNINGGATGGTNPTVDVGFTGDGDAFANELDADATTNPANTGASIGIELTADTEVFGRAGASAATGGTVEVAIYYFMADSGEA